MKALNMATNDARTHFLLNVTKVPSLTHGHATNHRGPPDSCPTWYLLLLSFAMVLGDITNTRLQRTAKHLVAGCLVQRLTRWGSLKCPHVLVKIG